MKYGTTGVGEWRSLGGLAPAHLFEVVVLATGVAGGPEGWALYSPGSGGSILPMAPCPTVGAWLIPG